MCMDGFRWLMLTVLVGLLAAATRCEQADQHGQHQRTERVDAQARRQVCRDFVVQVHQTALRRRRSALAMTDTELRLMAAANMGLNNTPNVYSTPAAIGMPAAL